MAWKNRSDLAIVGEYAGELSNFEKEMINLAEKKFPKEAKSFMSRVGSRLRTNVRRAYKRSTKQKTGNLLEGIERGKVYQYKGGKYQIRVRNIAPHAPLIEYGHDVYVNGKLTNHRAEGKHIMGSTYMKFGKTYEQMLDKWIDDLLDKGLS